MLPKWLRHIQLEREHTSKFMSARIWSNRELKKFAHVFHGSVVNVSGWDDRDKEGNVYKEYFMNSSDYFITNYGLDSERGYDNRKFEIKLDLEREVDEKLVNRFDVVFNHTVLEHVYHVRMAFRNMCLMAKKCVITIVPYLQQIHGFSESVGDYWRFTPFTMKKMYEENGFKLRYCSSNGNTRMGSVYLFLIGYYNNDYDKEIPQRFDLTLKGRPADYDNVIGAKTFNKEAIIKYFYRKMIQSIPKK